MAVRKSIRSRGFEISYRTDGSGWPLLLLSGWSMMADQWWDNGYADELRDDFRLIAVDRIGHGRSDRPHDPSAYEESSVIADLEAVLDAEGVDTAFVWGFSMGAATAAEFAVRHPARVAALVCGGGGPFPPEPGREQRMLQLSEAVATERGFAELMQSFGVDDADIIEIAGRNDPVALSLSMRAVASWSPDGERIRCPMLWYVGTLDDGGFRPGDHELAQRMGWETFEVAGATHATSFTDSAVPLSRVAPYLRRHRAA